MSRALDELLHFLWNPSHFRKTSVISASDTKTLIANTHYTEALQYQGTPVVKNQKAKNTMRGEM